MKRSTPAWGEGISDDAQRQIWLAYKVLERFPRLVHRHKYVAGGSAVAAALVTLAGVAVARRLRNGETEDEAVNGITEEELQDPRLTDDRRNISIGGEN